MCQQMEDAAGNCTFVQVMIEGATNVVVLQGERAGGPGSVSCQLRLAVDGKPRGGKRVTATAAPSFDPVWNEQFAIRVDEPHRSQLELTLWDHTNSTKRSASSYLGEVLSRT